MKRTKTQKGITLVALIITVVVLLILAVVAVTNINSNGILDYAQTAGNRYNDSVKLEENTILQMEDLLDKNGSGGSAGNGGSTSKITWTKTSTGELAIGSTVKTSTNEEFYVIGFAGTNNETVKLLAKNNLKADASAQDMTGALNMCKFSATSGFTSGENLNNNSKLKADTTSAVYKAIKYGEKLGETGRLMLKSEAEALQTTNSDILFGRNGKSSGTYLDYWLGSANDTLFVWYVNGSRSYLDNGIFFNYGSNCGVRPVIEILKSNIS